MKIHKLTLAALLVAIGTLSAHLIYIPAWHFQMLSRAACHQRAGSGDFRPRLCDSSGLLSFPACAICSVPAHCWLFPAGMIGACLAGLCYSRFGSVQSGYGRRDFSAPVF